VLPNLVNFILCLLFLHRFTFVKVCVYCVHLRLCSCCILCEINKHYLSKFADDDDAADYEYNNTDEICA